MSFYFYRAGGLNSPDYEKVRMFLLKRNSPHYTFARYDWMMAHSLLAEDWLEKIGIWTRADGEVLAVTLYDCQPGETFLLTLVEYTALYPEMIECAESHLNPGHDFSLVIPADDFALQTAAARKGYIRTSECEDVAVFDVSSRPGKVELPEGFSFTDMAVTFAPERYGEAIARGFGDAVLPELTDALRQRLHWQVCRRHVDPALKIAVVAPDGNFVCCCGLWFDDAADFAVVEPLSTLPQFRRRGLARGAVLEGIRRVAAFGATRVLVGSSQEFYYKVGFRPFQTAFFWKKSI